MASLDFDPEDYIDEISTEHLRRELENRAKKGAKDAAGRSAADERIIYRDELEDILRAVRDGRMVDVQVIVERCLYPKWTAEQWLKMSGKAH